MDNNLRNGLLTEQTTLPYSLALVVQAKYAQEFFAEDVAAIAQYFIKQAYVVTQ